ncbi:MAG: ABC transporter permease [Longimicrobiales bacterium]
MMRTSALALYRFLARALLPPGFRREYGEELEASVGARLTSKRGALGVLGATVVELLDLGWTAGREWWTTGRERWTADGERWTATTKGSARSIGGLGRGEGIMGGIWRDLRIAARSLTRRPGFALGVALTLGLGIGATTTIYSVVDGVLFRPLPYDDPSTLVAVGTLAPGAEWIDREAGLQDLGLISIPNYLDFRERTRSFQNSAVFEPANVFLPDTGDGLEVVPAVVVSSDLFEILGVSPFLGRTFAPEEYTSAPDEGVVMLTYGAWQRRYGSDPGVLGQSLQQIGRLATSYSRATVVGVLPRDFRAPEAFFPSDEAPEFWFPLQSDQQPRY